MEATKVTSSTSPLCFPFVSSIEKSADSEAGVVLGFQLIYRLGIQITIRIEFVQFSERGSLRKYVLHFMYRYITPPDFVRIYLVTASTSRAQTVQFFPDRKLDF